MRFDESDVDQARAAGVVIEFERSAPIIVDRSLYRELVKAAITRTVTELEAKVAARQEERKAARQSQKTSGAPADPAAEVEREHRSRMRELSDQAHGVNLDVGAGLLNGLSTVDPTDVNVAKFFVYSLLGADYDDSPYTQQGERVARLAVSGIRLVIEEFRADVTKTRKDGSKGALRIDYGNGREPQEPLRWLWKYVDGAKTAGELYGRALVVIAAEQYASRLVVPQSQRTHPTRWARIRTCGQGAGKLAGPHLPASLRQLEAAVKRAHEERDRASQRARAAARRSSRADTAADETPRPRRRTRPPTMRPRSTSTSTRLRRPTRPSSSPTARPGGRWPPPGPRGRHARHGLRRGVPTVSSAHCRLDLLTKAGRGARPRCSPNSVWAAAWPGCSLPLRRVARPGGRAAGERPSSPALAPRRHHHELRRSLMAKTRRPLTSARARRPPRRAARAGPRLYRATAHQRRLAGLPQRPPPLPELQPAQRPLDPAPAPTAHPGRRVSTWLDLGYCVRKRPDDVPEGAGRSGSGRAASRAARDTGLARGRRRPRRAAPRDLQARQRLRPGPGPSATAAGHAAPPRRRSPRSVATATTAAAPPGQAQR